MKRDQDRPAYEDRGDAAAELDSHLQMAIDDLQERGLSRDEAVREAHRRFGERSAFVEECRELDRRLERSEQRSDALVDLHGDLRQALRRLAEAPVAALWIVLSLALSIGATTVLFSLVRGVLLQPLPYDRPAELALLSAENEERGWDGMPLPPGVFDELRAEPASSFELAVYRSQQTTLLQGEEPRRLRIAAVSGNLLDLLGTQPHLGRSLDPRDLKAAEGVPCLLSHGLWQRDFGSDDSILGRALRLEGDVSACDVVGVLPAAFDFPDAETELVTLYRPDPGERSWSNWSLRGLVRVAGGTDLEAAQLELDQRTQAWADRLPFGGAWRFVAESLHESRVREVRPALWVLLGSVSMVLLIACANLGGLLMARTAERRGELTLRSALGATRWRIARQLLAENLVLCGLGGLGGIALATVGLSVFKAQPPIDLPRLDEVQLDGWMLAFASLATGAAVVLSWLPPLSYALRSSSHVGDSRSTGSRVRSRARAGLVVVEAALAVALLVGAGLLARSFLSLTAVDPGFDTVDTASVRIELPASRYPDDAAKRSFHDELLRRLQAVPGVTGVGVTTGLPLQGVSRISRLHLEGDVTAVEDRSEAAIDAVSPDYFSTLGIPLLEGRLFDRRDHEDAPLVAVINQAIADRHFAEGFPVGRTLLLDEDGPAVTIVGVVASVKQYGLDLHTPLQYFLPFAQDPRGTAHFVLRAQLPPQMLREQIRDALQSIDPALPLSPVATFGESLSSSVARERFYAVAMVSFAGLAALLVALGLYGVMAHAVERRRRELSVRMALGADRRTVFVSVVKRGLGLGLLGILLGLGLALGLSSAMEGLLFGVTSSDLATFAASSLLVLAIAGLASSLPAARATAAELAEVLRSE